MQRARSGIGAVTDHLERGRAYYARRAWADAFDALTLADHTTPLGCDDLERLAMAAFLTNRETEYIAALDRVHRDCLAADLPARAARAAFWIGLCHLFRGEFGPATGWFGRARRTLDRHGADCVEQGYLLLPQIEQRLAAHDGEQALKLAVQAVNVGERFADPDLVTCARHLQGRALLLQDRVEPGLALLDEAMVAVVAGELSPRMTGLVYCSVIEKCMTVCAFSRAREWTFLLSRWCEEQPQLVTFTARCLVHRAEVLQLQGDWDQAIEEARRACTAGAPQPPVAAVYRLGELHRVRGRFAEAEAAYSEASARGFEPQPGLALLRLAEGRIDAAAVSIRGAVASAKDRYARLRLLGAAVEILLAAGETEQARSALRDLDAGTRPLDSDVPGAIAAQARGAVALARGDAAAALPSLRDAFERWQAAGTPYEAARARELVGLACRTLGDEDGAKLELAAATATYAELGAAHDLSRRRSDEARESLPRGLSKRELQVLRLLAAGKTNRAIAADLGVSPRTVDRHVSNLFGKLGVCSRVAATAYAHRNGLL